MFEKRRLEIIIERPAFKRACRILEDGGVTGYTAFSAYAGFGSGQRWSRGTDLSSTQDMVMIISIIDEDVIPKCLENLEKLVGSHIGVVSVSSVDVFRDDQF